MATSEQRELTDLIQSIQQRQSQQKPEPNPEKLEGSKRVKCEFTPVPAEVTELRRLQEQAMLAKQEQSRRVAALRAFIAKRGARYAGCRFRNFEAPDTARKVALQQVREFAAAIPNGRNVLLYGPKGTGKDHLLAALARYAIINRGLSVEWWNGADLFGEVRDRMERREPEKAFIQANVRPDVLMISDPAITGGLTAHQAAILNRIIDGRYSHFKPTWISTNVSSAAELEKTLTPTVADRLRENALAIWCNWSSYRNRAQEATP